MNMNDHASLDQARSEPSRQLIFAINQMAGNGSVPPVVSWLRSLPTADAVGAIVGERYGLTVRSCGELDAPEGPRPFALSEWVEGTKPQPPAGDDLFRDFGSLIGRFHAAGADFRSGHPRRPASLSTMLDEPLRAIAPYLDSDHADRVATLAARAREQLSARELAWGIRHGDVTLDNIHRSDRGLVLHDFDLAEPGWLAADLTGVHATGHWHAFADGYTAEHPLPDLPTIPWLEVCRLIENLRFHLVEKPRYRGLESLAEGWADHALALVGELSARLL